MFASPGNETWATKVWEELSWAAFMKGGEGRPVPAVELFTTL